MSSNSWNQALSVAQLAGAALSNTSTPTSLLPPQAKFTWPAGQFKIGDAIRVKASGIISTAAAAPGTLTLDVRTGGSVVLFTSGASPTLATSASNLTWDFETMLTVRGIGTAATIIGTGRLLTAALSAATPVMLCPTSSPVVGGTFDSTSSFVQDFFATWSVVSASNSIQLLQYSLEYLT